MRQIARLIMRGRTTAVLAAGLFGGLSLIVLPFSILSAAALGLFTLRRGDVDGLIVLLGGAAIIAATQTVVPPRPGFAFPLVLALFPPVWVCARALRRTQSQERVLLLAGGFAAALAVGMHVAFGDVVSWWQSWLEHAITGVKGATLGGFEREGTSDFMNGFVAMVYGIAIMGSMLLARWWQAILFNPGGFRQEFHTLKLPRTTLPVIIGVVAAGAVFGRGVATDLTMVATMVYFFQGLAVLHGVVASRKLSQVWVVPPYVFLAILPQYVIVGMAMAGALDALLNFRAMGR